MKSKWNDENEPLMETVLRLLISHNGPNPCVCPDEDRQWGFISILTIPFLWLTFPKLVKVILVLSNNSVIYVCLLSNIMEAGVFSAGHVYPHDMVRK